MVGCRSKLEKSKLKQGTRVTLDMTTLTIMRPMPREVDPTVFNMLNDEGKAVDFTEIYVSGGLKLLTYRPSEAWWISYRSLGFSKIQVSAGLEYVTSRPPQAWISWDPSSLRNLDFLKSIPRVPRIS